MNKNYWEYNKDKRVEKGFLIFVGSALAFSLMTVCIKQTENRIPIYELIFFRSIFSLLVTGSMLKIYGIYCWGKNHKLLLARGLIGTGALFCVFKAVNSLPLATATIIQYTYPTLTALLAWLILGEAIRKRIFIGIILGWFGIQVVVKPLLDNNSSQQISVAQVIIALSGSALTALAYVIVRRLSKKENPLVIFFYFALVSIAITTPFMLHEATQPAKTDFIWISGIVFFAQIGQILLTEGLAILPAAYAVSISYTQVLFATLLGVFIFSEPLTIYILTGGVCVLGSTLITISQSPDLQ